MTTNYITLQITGDPTTARRYKVVKSPITFDKKVSVTRTIGGISIQAGNTYEVYNMTIVAPIVPQSVPDGSYADLRDLLRHKGTLTMTDWYGNTFDVAVVSNAKAVPLTTIIDGNSAYFFVDVQLMRIQPL